MPDSIFLKKLNLFGSCPNENGPRYPQIQKSRYDTIMMLHDDVVTQPHHVTVLLLERMVNGMIVSLPHVVCTYAGNHRVCSLTLKIIPTLKAEAGVQNVPKTSAVCKEGASSNS